MTPEQGSFSDKTDAATRDLQKAPIGTYANCVSRPAVLSRCDGFFNNETRSGPSNLAEQLPWSISREVVMDTEDMQVTIS